MQRILIVGSPGSGKSTLSRIMAERLGLPIVHLDRLFWRPGWLSAPREEFDALLSEALKGESWIIDGNFGRTLEMRLKRADTVIMLDYPTRVCLFRAFKRQLLERRKDRPDMTEGCREHVDFEFLNYIRTFRKKYRPSILSRIEAADGIKVIIIKNKKEYREFLNSNKY